MGIKNFNCFENYGEYGAIPHNPKHVGIYLDGEFLHFKGRTAEACTAMHPEYEIPRIAANFTKTLVDQIKSTLPSGVNVKVYAYFDGTRHDQKVKRIDTSELDRKSIVSMFKVMLEQNNIEIVQLKDAEAELCIYTQRNTDNCINVLVTGDSDMYAILAGHLPKVNGVREAKRPEIVIEKKQTKFGTLSLPYYSKDGPKVTDSILWVFIKKNYVFVNADYMHFNMGTNQFRHLCAYMGTDYTPPVFTKSMVTSILNTFHSNPLLDAIDSLELFVLFVCCGFVLKNTRKPAKIAGDPTSKLRTILNNAAIYTNYIENGVFIDNPQTTVDAFNAITFVITKTCGSSRTTELAKFVSANFGNYKAITDAFITNCNVETPDKIYDLDLVNEIATAKNKKSLLSVTETKAAKKRFNNLLGYFGMSKESANKMKCTSLFKFLSEDKGLNSIANMVENNIRTGELELPSGSNIDDSMDFQQPINDDCESDDGYDL